MFLEMTMEELVYLEGGTNWGQVYNCTVGSVLIANSLGIAAICLPVGIAAACVGGYMLYNGNKK